MHKERLLTLATFLRERVPNGHFDLETFVNGDATRLAAIARGEIKGCGTTACAIGWCPVIWPTRAMYDSEAVSFDGRPEIYPGQKFFDVSSDVWTYLFSMKYDRRLDVSAKLTARRIEQFVAKGGM